MNEPSAVPAGESGVMGPVVTPEFGAWFETWRRGEWSRQRCPDDPIEPSLYWGASYFAYMQLAWDAGIAARSASAVPTGRESASPDVAHRDTREGLERSATELREQAEADAKRIFGGRSTTRDRE